LVQISILTAFFDHLEDAREAFSALGRLPAEAGVRVLDAALMVPSEAGRIEKDPPAEKPAPTAGAYSLASLFPAEVLDLKAMGSKAQAAAAHFREYGLETNLLQEIGENVAPSGAALVAIVEEAWTEDLEGLLSASAGVAFHSVVPEASQPLGLGVPDAEGAGDGS
jgi:uncharacterized membrane protein